MAHVIEILSCRFAIGNAERPMLRAKIGWLDHLANATHQFYTANNTGGPGIKVGANIIERKVRMNLNFLLRSYEIVPIRNSVILHLQQSYIGWVWQRFSNY
jgi:hypothetical protein